MSLKLGRVGWYQAVITIYSYLVCNKIKCGQRVGSLGSSSASGKGNKGRLREQQLVTEPSEGRGVGCELHTDGVQWMQSLST